MRTISVALCLAVSIGVSGIVYGSDLPWSSNQECDLGDYSPKGMIPPMLTTLEDLSLSHRITQGFNPSLQASNYHGADSEFNGISYSSAVDLSIRCLDDNDIKILLGELVMRGFASWLRRDGEDGWRGAAHIHAIWVLGQLKPQLDSQVKKWLVGRNGLSSDKVYEFWRPTGEQFRAVEIGYNQ